MSVIEIDTTAVRWPNTPVVKTMMKEAIHRYAKEEGYTHFSTMTLPCLNGIESPGPDPNGPPGWIYLDFFPDCELLLVDNESAVFPDIRLFAKKLT